MNNIKTAQTRKGLIEYSYEGEGPTVLIIHGGHGNCRSNYKQKILLKKGFSVLIPTRPGYKGTPIETGKTAEATADVIASLLDYLRIKDVFVIGNSAGGPVSLEFAKRYSSKIKKYILESAVIKPWFHKLTIQYYGIQYIFHPKRQKRFWENLVKQLEKNEKKTLLKNLKLFTKINPQEVLCHMSKEDIELLKKYMITENDSGTGFINDVRHRATNIDKISIPTLIIHSKNDGSVPFSHAEYAHRKIRNSELFVAPTETHFIYIGPGSEEVLKKRVDFLLN
ncbi:MAG: alpha/beta hydrolase [bacterium]